MDVAVLTHRRPEQVAEALAVLHRLAAEHGATVHFDPDEAAKHGVEVSSADGPFDLCLVLGGDGTILTALRRFAGTATPVFAVNFGEVGFLATVDPDRLEEGLSLALRGEFDRMELPAIVVRLGDEEHRAINDVSFHRKQGARVADLAYAIGEDEVGRVRCDGLVVATPAGSTGYNLANGGPVMAWGVEGFVVSFIAPHSLTARTLVVAPNDVLTVSNRSREEAADVTVDGRVACELAPGDPIELRFLDGQAVLAQLPAATFYHRLREKFGRLAF
ncbi:MAG TPA: NAD(+)/NADH kinase [Solirubrobacteraceae bacterium]|nr:NAD(+)/NADH kinase [Solirubrobacteraceae bacterium]